MVRRKLKIDRTVKKEQSFETRELEERMLARIAALEEQISQLEEGLSDAHNVIELFVMAARWSISSDESTKSRLEGFLTAVAEAPETVGLDQAEEGSTDNPANVVQTDSTLWDIVRLLERRGQIGPVQGESSLLSRMRRDLMSDESEADDIVSNVSDDDNDDIPF